MENVSKQKKMLSYEDYYFDSFSKLISKSVFKINKKIVKKEFFFNSLVKETEILKKNKGRLFFAGNGASAAFSNHMALDWSKNGKINSFSLSDSSLISALSNDISYEEALCQFLEIYNFNDKDMVITISSSGNSKNIINVINYCKKNNIRTVGFSGLNKNNSTQKLADYSIFVPSKTYGFSECIHQFFLHLWLDKYMKIEEWKKTSSQNMDSSNFKI